MSGASSKSSAAKDAKEMRKPIMVRLPSGIEVSSRFRVADIGEMTIYIEFKCRCLVLKGKSAYRDLEAKGD